MKSNASLYPFHELWATMTIPSFFAHVFTALHIVFMSGIGFEAIHQSGNIIFTE